MTAEFAPPPGKGVNLQQKYADKLDDFWFFWADRWWKLPNLNLLDFDIQLQVMAFQGRVSEDSTDAEALKSLVNDLFDLIMEAGHPGQAADWREVTRPLTMLLGMLGDWSEHSGVDEGESSASTSSSKSTGRPSKPTSKRSTGSGSPRRSTAQTRAAGAPPAS